MSHLGIDLGGTKLALALADPSGEPAHSVRHPTPRSGDPEADLAEIIRLIEVFLAERSGGVRPVSVGASVPGPADPVAGVLINPPNLPGWRDVPIGPRLADALGAPVRIENDANAAVLAEARYGAGRGVADLLYLTMSTGVGGGVISGGRLVRGAFGAAGEVGHLPIVPAGERCACGLRGCLEAYVGGLAWQTRLRERAPIGPDLLDRVEGDRSRLAPEHVVEAARAGGASARAELDWWLDHLAQGIAALVMVLEPRRVLLGTIAVAAGRALCFDPLRERLADRLWPHQLERLEIEPAGLGASLAERAGLAVALAGDA